MPAAFPPSTSGAAEQVAARESNLSRRLILTACHIFGVTEDDLYSDKRVGISEARWAIAYVLSRRVGWNDSRIGRFLHKNHAAIRYGLAQAEQLRRQDEQFLEALELLESEI